MSGFSAEWLSAREPVDHAARSKEVLAAVAHYFANDPSIRITDIGSGTGSTVRALDPFISNKIAWDLVDNDAVLMDQAKNNKLISRDAETRLHDLAASIDPLFVGSPSLITTSAFLDLVSEQWLQELSDEVTKRHIPFYAALTYNGDTSCTPSHPCDSEILAAFNLHQRGDKGFGPSLGPNAASTAVNMFEANGYQVISEISDWVGDNRHREFQKMLIEGWHEAACEIEPEKRNSYDNWLEDRLEMINSGASTVRVGHLDFFAVPKN